MRALKAAAVAAVVALLLTGCFGPGEDELIERASADFGTLVDHAAAVDVEVLHSLEVEAPAAESCDNDADHERTVFVAAGTMAIQSDAVDERVLVDGFEPSPRADDKPWTEITKGTSGIQRAWVDVDGITATVTVDEGLLVVAVFSPCR